MAWGRAHAHVMFSAHIQEQHITPVKVTVGEEAATCHVVLSGWVFYPPANPHRDIPTSCVAILLALMWWCHTLPHILA